MSELNKGSIWRQRGVSEFVCPTGEVVELRRLSKEMLLMSGRLPAVLVERVIEALQAMGKLAEGGEESASLNLTDPGSAEKVKAMPALVDAYLIAGVARPRVVYDGADESKGEINVHDIPDADRLAIFHELANGSPSVPVKTDEGEVTHEAIANFPAGGQLPAGNAARGDGEDVRVAPLAAVGAQG